MAATDGRSGNTGTEAGCGLGAGRTRWRLFQSDGENVSACICAGKPYTGETDHMARCLFVASLPQLVVKGVDEQPP
jgi:hypothetical protein